MHREMRRKDRQLSEKEAREILDKGEFGFLATVGENGQPYVVPLSYAVSGDEILFHCAKEGHKIDNIKHESRVCFSVAYDAIPVFHNADYSTYFESAVIFGNIYLVGEDRKKEALYKIVEKYFPNYEELERENPVGGMDRTDVYAISIEHITGKAKRKAQ